MFSAFVVSRAAAGAPDLAADLEAVGIKVLGRGDTASMVQDVIRTAPDLVVCADPHPDDALFACIKTLDASAPRPTVVFTSDPDAEKIDRATRSGVHVYIVNGYGPHRLRSVVHVAQARFRYTQGLRTALDEVNHRFAERKLVDRAKGILMRLRDLSEDEAYGVLRSAAMKTKQRIGQAAQVVIDAARYGEAVNRAGQLRMISQRLVKLYALMAADIDAPEARRLHAETLALAEATLLALARILSKATFGDLLDAVADPWQALKAALAAPPALPRLAAVDRLAERLLQQAEQLTTNLENAGFVAALRLINVSGRQRMLSQRFAKQALLAALLPDEAAAAARERGASVAAFSQAMTYLGAVPLATPSITAELDAAARDWSALQACLPGIGTAAGQRTLFALSETLLARFEALTADYERNLQSLLA